MNAYIRFAPVLAAATVTVVVLASLLLAGHSSSPSALPQPQTNGKMSLEQALQKRRSVREFLGGDLTLEQISQLCWAAQGITDPKRGYRTCPSAGALYPLELYVVTRQGVSHYVPQGHKLKEHLAGDLRTELANASLHQPCVARGSATFVIAAVTSRTAARYGRRAERYVLLEAGHAAQNLLLQATALGLGAVPVGAFEDDKIAELLKLPEGCQPVYLVPVGPPLDAQERIRR